MYREIRLDECPGKTLKGVWISEAIAVIVFADETFTTLRGDADHDNVGEIYPYKLDILRFSVLHFSHKKLIESGILTQGELDDLVRKRDADDRERDLQWRRQHYEILKKEFEG